MREFIIYGLIIFIIVLFIIQLSGGRIPGKFSLDLPKLAQKNFIMKIFAIRFSVGPKYIISIALIVLVVVFSFLFYNRPQNIAAFFPAVLHSNDLVNGDIYMFFNSDGSYDISLDGMIIVKTGKYEIKKHTLFIDGAAAKVKIKEKSTIIINDIKYKKNENLNIKIPNGAPENVLDEYLTFLVTKQYDKSYQILSKANKKRIPYEIYNEYMTKQNAVRNIKSYKIDPSYSKAYNYSISNDFFECAYQYNVILNAVGNNENQRYDGIRFFVVSEGGSKWNVYLYDFNINANLIDIENDLKNGDIGGALPEEYAGPNIISWPVVIAPVNKAENDKYIDSKVMDDGSTDKESEKKPDKKLEDYLDAIIY